MFRQLCIRWRFLDYHLSKYRWYRRRTGYIWINWSPKIYSYMCFWERASSLQRHADFVEQQLQSDWSSHHLENAREYY